MTNRPNRDGSILVGTGILLSRLAGLLREVVARGVLGLTPAADALAAAMRIPNLLQNLLGEGVLSASFVPVYSQLLDDDDDKREASRVAGAVGAFLMVVTGLSVLLLVLAARPITNILAFGLSGERFEMAVDFTRIMAVGVGFLVMSAWCLGILNSHRNFFLPYAAPVLWNAMQIVMLVVAYTRDWSIEDAARGMAIGVTLGGVAQLAIQLPTTLRLARGLRLRLDGSNPRVREVRRRFGPAVMGRGVVQLSAYLDLFMASFLVTGALAALQSAQILYTLPISLFVMSVAAAELPELSRIAADPQAVINRTERGLRRIAFWMLAASMLSIAAGELIVRMLFERGEFTSSDTSLVWLVVAFYAAGLPALGLSRMLQNTCYALGDTARPARIAAIRVAISAAVGALLMFPLDRVMIGPDGILDLSEALGITGPLPSEVRTVSTQVRLGAVGLAIGSSIGSWVEFILLNRLIRRRLPELPTPSRILFPPGIAAALAFIVTAATKLAVDDLPSLIAATLAVGVGGTVYVVIAFRTGVKEAEMVLKPVRRAIWR